jgi:DNA-directed RNA polymerase specialized sigma24 family protein
MLGSLVDSEDAVQDTMLRALRALSGFVGRADQGVRRPKVPAPSAAAAVSEQYPL